MHCVRYYSPLIFIITWSFCSNFFFYGPQEEQLLRSCYSSGWSPHNSIAPQSHRHCSTHCTLTSLWTASGRSKNLYLYRSPPDMSYDIRFEKSFVSDTGFFRFSINPQSMNVQIFFISKVWGKDAKWLRVCVCAEMFKVPHQTLCKLHWWTMTGFPTSSKNLLI